MVRFIILASLLLAGGAQAATRHHEAALIGMRACVEIGDDDVSVIPHGFHIRSINQFVHYDNAFPSALLPSSDSGSYWLCRYRDGDVRFFAPQRAL